MPDGIVRDPKQNLNTEADFGVLMDITSREFYLYFKGPFQSNNPKRYWTAGTEVEYSGPVRDLNRPYSWNNQYWNEIVTKWVRVHLESSTGPVVRNINTRINGQDLPFPEDKEYLSDYTDDQELAEETAKYRK